MGRCEHSIDYCTRLDHFHGLQVSKPTLLASLVRIATAVARLHQRNVVDEQPDAALAVVLMEQTLTNKVSVNSQTMKAHEQTAGMCHSRTRHWLPVSWMRVRLVHACVLRTVAVCLGPMLGVLNFCRHPPDNRSQYTPSRIRTNHSQAAAHDKQQE